MCRWNLLGPSWNSQAFYDRIIHTSKARAMKSGVVGKFIITLAHALQVRILIETVSVYAEHSLSLEARQSLYLLEHAIAMHWEKIVKIGPQVIPHLIVLVTPHQLEQSSAVNVAMMEFREILFRSISRLSGIKWKSDSRFGASRSLNFLY